MKASSQAQKSAAAKPSAPPVNASMSAPSRKASASAFPRAEFRPRRSMVGYSRLCWIHEELKAGKAYTTKKLAEALYVTERTVRRDLRSLEIEFGQDVRFDVRRNTFYLASAGKELPHVPVTQGELFMLCLAQEALGAHADSAFGRTLQRALGKLEASLNRRLDGRLEELMASICFRHIGGGAMPDPLVFDTVAEAVGIRRELLCDYQAQGRQKPIHRRLRPRCLVRLGATWYLLAHQTGSRKGLTLALSRMSNLRFGEKHFSPEEGTTLREELEQCIGIFGGTPQAVRVRLEGAAARVTEEQRLHPSQRMAPTEEGSHDLSMEVAVNVELERWVLGWGEHAEVIEPPALRQKVAERLAKAAARYASAPKVGPSTPEVEPCPAKVRRSTTEVDRCTSEVDGSTSEVRGCTLEVRASTQNLGPSTLIPRAATFAEEACTSGVQART